MRECFLLLACLLTWWQVPCMAETPTAHEIIWKIDPQRSEMHFHLSALGFIGVGGVIADMQGEVWRQDGIAHVELRVPLQKLQMSSERRTRWALSDEFFAAAAHPQLIFSATLREGTQIDSLEGPLSGRVDLRGINAAVEIILSKPVCEDQHQVCRLNARGSVSRQRFGMTTRKLTLSDAVNIELSVTLVKAVAPVQRDEHSQHPRAARH